MRVPIGLPPGPTLDWNRINDGYEHWVAILSTRIGVLTMCRGRTYLLRSIDHSAPCQPQGKPLGPRHSLPAGLRDFTGDSSSLGRGRQGPKQGRPHVEFSLAEQSRSDYLVAG